MMLALVAFCALPFLACSQDDEETSGMVPPLGVVMPLKKVDDVVVVTAPVLLNLDAIVPVGAVARTIFIMPEPSDPDVRQAHKRRGVDPDAIGGDEKGAQFHAPTSELSPYQKAALDRAYATNWTNIAFFRAALERFVNMSSRFVYQIQGEKNLHLEVFDFPQGMFLSETSGQVTVLTLQRESPSYESGMRAGAVLSAIDGKPLGNTLKSFVNLYASELNGAQKHILPKIHITYHPADSQEEKDFAFSVPQSLDQNFWSISDAMDKSAPAGTNRPTPPPQKASQP